VKNILQNKNTPYVLGLICAVAFFAAHIYFNIAVPKVNLWSYEALCEIGFLLMLLSLVPFMCERILRANGQRRGAGFTVLLIAQCLLAGLAFVCFVLSAVLTVTERGTQSLNIIMLIGLIAAALMSLMLLLLRLCVLTSCKGAVTAVGWVLLGSAAAAGALLHLTLLLDLIKEIAANAGQGIGILLFWYGFVNFVYIMCLFLADGACIYFAVHTVRRLENEPSPLMYL
jgi:membrane protein